MAGIEPATAPVRLGASPGDVGRCQSDGRFLQWLVRQGRIDRSVVQAKRADGARLDLCRFVGASHPQIERLIEQKSVDSYDSRILQNLAESCSFSMRVFTGRLVLSEVSS